MTELLIRLCVAFCGLLTLVIGVAFIADGVRRMVILGCLRFLIGLITILRALGVM